MNYLAHLRLAPPEDGLRVGNLLGDFAQGLDLADLPAALRQGVEHHREIDRFTDHHPAFRRSRARLPETLQRFGGVLVDVYYDHFLARHWERFGDGRPLTEFTQDCYRALDDHADLLPRRMNRAAFHLRRLDWLARYRDVFHVDDVTEKIAGRMRRRTPIAEGGRALRASYGGFERDFYSIFPDLLRLATQA